MTRDDGAALDPEVLADPVQDDRELELEPGGKEPDGSSPPTSLVPSRGGGLVPSDPYRRYIAEVGRYQTLDREEEQELSRRYRETGDREALFRLITANLMLVVRVAHSFRRAARNLLDLIQEGNLGLLQAVERFDPELGVRLPTYAAWWVRAYMVKFLLDNVRLVRVGTTNARRKLLRNLRKEKERLSNLGYEVGPPQLAAHFGVSEEDVTEVQKALSSRDVSLDEPVGTDSDRRAEDVFVDDRSPGIDEAVARKELQERTEAAIASFRHGLKSREESILDLRILAEEPLTLQALGDRFGTTREAVRQAEQRLMKRLEGHLRTELGDLGSIEIGPS